MESITIDGQHEDAFRQEVLLAAILIDSILNPRNEETAQQGDI